MRQEVAAAVLAGAAAGAACVYLLAALRAVAQRLGSQEQRLEAAIGAGVVCDGFEGMVGNTPLVLLRSLSQATGCIVLAKAEFLNPGGSVKDRTVKGMLAEAERQGKIPRKGGEGTVVEGSVGSTGLALAMQCAARGLACHIYQPSDAAEEKAEAVRVLGGRVTRVPPVAFVDPGHYVQAARRHAVTQGGHFADQFEAESNAAAHRRGLGREVVEQLRRAGLAADAVVMGAGTGGTIAGVGAALRDAGCGAQVVLADVQGSGLAQKVNAGVMYARTEAEGTRRRHQTDSVVEGIGLKRLTQNFASCLPYVEEAIGVSDEEAVLMSRYLIRHEGLFLGGSSAVHCVAAVRKARALGPGHVLVTLLCDSGSRYMSNFYSDPFLASRGLPTGPQALEAAKDLTWLK